VWDKPGLECLCRTVFFARLAAFWCFPRDFFLPGLPFCLFFSLLLDRFLVLVFRLGLDLAIYGTSLGMLIPK
jgi:hypothetical protein